MPFAAKLNEIGSKHDGHREAVIKSVSPTVSIDGLLAARMGEPLTPHDKSEHLF